MNKWLIVFTNATIDRHSVRQTERQINRHRRAFALTQICQERRDGAGLLSVDQQPGTVFVHLVYHRGKRLSISACECVSVSKS